MIGIAALPTGNQCCRINCVAATGDSFANSSLAPHGNRGECRSTRAWHNQLWLRNRAFRLLCRDPARVLTHDRNSHHVLVSQSTSRPALARSVGKENWQTWQRFDLIRTRNLLDRSSAIDGCSALNRPTQTTQFVVPRSYPTEYFLIAG